MICGCCLVLDASVVDVYGSSPHRFCLRHGFFLGTFDHNGSYWTYNRFIIIHYNFVWFTKILV